MILKLDPYLGMITQENIKSSLRKALSKATSKSTNDVKSLPENSDSETRKLTNWKHRCEPNRHCVTGIGTSELEEINVIQIIKGVYIR